MNQINQRNFKSTWLVLFFLFTFISSAFSTDYYISSEGDDSNSGTNPEQAWKTLDKVNQVEFSAGDNIYFKRGDSWRGTLLITSSGTDGNPITYSAYGEGAEPI